MSVTDAAETNASSNGGWGQSATSAWDSGSTGANQWLVNSDKVCGSWAQAVSGGDQSSSSASAAAASSSGSAASNPQMSSNIPNNKQSIGEPIEENGSQINQQIVSSHFDELTDELYSTRWGSSVINHDNGWDLNSPSSANNSHGGANTAGGFKPLDPASLSNLGTELWHNNLRQTRELTNSELLQSPGAQQNAAGLEPAEAQWKKLVAGTATHFGGTWGEEEDMSNVWTGIPNSGPAGSQANQLVANQLAAANNQTRSTSATSNVFRQNSINCGKANAQLLSNNSNWISDDNENWGKFLSLAKPSSELPLETRTNCIRFPGRRDD